MAARDTIHDAVKNAIRRDCKMDKIGYYQKLIKDFFLQYKNLLLTPPQSDLNIIMALDDENCQYLLFKAGWRKDEYLRYFMLHVFLENNKIWIEEDMTEEGIATYFLKQGVPREDIVLAFHHPSMRPLTEFAVA